MMLHLHRYIELPVPLRRARELLAQRPLLGEALRLGQRWRWLDQLWCFEVHVFDDNRIIWRGQCLTREAGLACVALRLHDAVISTHVVLHLALDLPGVGLWTRRGVRRRLALALDQALQALQDELRAVTSCAAPEALPDEPVALAERLRASHPQTVAAFEAMAALPALAAVAALDRRWQATEAGAVAAEVYEPVVSLPALDGDFDLVYAGGGLGLLHAALMAQRYGCRVLLFDRGEVGCAHREWNISDQELRALIDVGLCTPAELEAVVMRRYRDGLVRFWPGQSAVRPAALCLPDVLNVSLDAGALLRLARHKLEAAGGVVLDRRTFARVLVERPGRVAVELRRADGALERFGARVVIDAMGATSPLALRRYAGRPFAGVCPTVGTVVAGLEPGPALDQHHPERGDILISVSDTQGGRQLIWEGFAGRDDELTVYLFYYDLLGAAPRVGRGALPLPGRRSLLDLFEIYFQLLPTYKRPGAAFRHIKPVYGFIPARHAQRRQSVPLLTGVLPLGDASAQQSPLTFCGFGSFVRNLERTTALLALALRHHLLRPEQLGWISAYQANVALNWVFSRFMQPWRSPNDVNRLQNIFARVLNDLGSDVAVRFFKDRMTWRDYGRIVNRTLVVYPAIIPTALEVLGVRGCARWAADWLRFSGAALLAAGGRAIGDRCLTTLAVWLERRAPAVALRLRARQAEWLAMGWLPPAAHAARVARGATMQIGHKPSE